jgi:hypothetical protein
MCPLDFAVLTDAATRTLLAGSWSYPTIHGRGPYLAGRELCRGRRREGQEITLVDLRHGWAQVQRSHLQFMLTKDLFMRIQGDRS